MRVREGKGAQQALAGRLQGDGATPLRQEALLPAALVEVARCRRDVLGRQQAVLPPCEVARRAHEARRRAWGQPVLPGVLRQVVAASAAEAVERRQAARLPLDLGQVARRRDVHRGQQGLLPRVLGKVTRRLRPHEVGGDESVLDGRRRTPRARADALDNALEAVHRKLDGRELLLGACVHITTRLDDQLRHGAHMRMRTGG